MSEVAEPVAEVEIIPPDIDPVRDVASPEPEPETPVEGASDDGGEPDAPDAAEISDPEPEAPAPKRKDWREARLAEETAKRKEAQRERDEHAAKIKDLEARIASAEAGEPIDGGVKATPEQIRAEAERIVAVQNSVEAANRVFDAGVKAHPDFEQVRDRLVSAFGEHIQARPDFLEAITSLPNGHDVFHALGNDLDHAAEVLGMPSVKMAVELAALSTKLQAPKSRPVSAAPEPIRPLNGKAKGERSVYDENLSDEEFYALRDRQRKAAHDARH